MPTDDQRSPRADAARNVKRLLDAARTVYAEQGPDARLETIADQAGVGLRTLFRHFPNKESLVRTALQQAIAESLAVVIHRTSAYYDPLLGLLALMEAVLELIDRERNTFAAADNPGALIADVIAPVHEPLGRLTERAQAAGTIRPDLTGEDVVRVIGMIASSLWSLPEGEQGWRRYLLLIFDAFRPAAPLPPPSPLPGS